MLGAEHLLIWDQAMLARPSSRASILARGFSAASSTEAAAWPIGERDAYLLSVHRAAFGDRLDLLANCPSCAEPAAFEVSIAALLQQRGTSEWPLRVEFGSLTLICRRPNAADLAAAWANTDSLEEARRRLFVACVDGRSAGDEPLDPGQLDESAIAAASAALAGADPLADIRFALTCPTCATAWEALFDPPRVLWRAFDAWARSALYDVRQLARSYGWSERDILAMHPSRRQFYLDAVT
jgi:hypothetical protein